MRTIETKVYRFDELNEVAKEKAREWYRRSSDGDNYYAEYVIEDAVEIAGLFGLTIDTRPVNLMNGKTRQEPCIYWSGFSSQGDGACFEGNYRHKADSVGAVNGYCNDAEILRIATDLTDIQGRHENALVATIKQRGRYYHALSMDIDVENTGDGEIDNDDFRAMQGLIVSFANWIYRALETEYNYQNSDKAVDENILANEYEFTETGERA